ncbi:hypothetical protein CEXT_653781 [Caerostris extrusa]|uniref:Uncharacterized protein n=1 Tax=Caerostris extrusa TaxID=172846 RepID=A0AAV4ND62_CAEEX|nr:hypothetical protein CEXT_653781 [Caerostris extrusa]
MGRGKVGISWQYRSQEITCHRLNKTFRSGLVRWMRSPLIPRNAMPLHDRKSPYRLTNGKRIHLAEDCSISRLRLVCVLLFIPRLHSFLLKT